MKPRFEPRRLRPSAQSFIAYQRIEPVFPFAWHYHPEWELTWIEAGSGSRIVGDNIEAYEPGDLVLLAGGLPHTWSSEKPARRARAHRAVVVQFPPDFFVSALIDRPEFLAIGDLLARAGRGLAFPTKTALHEATGLTDLTKARGLDAWCRLASLLDRLARVPDARALASARYTPSAGHGAQRRFERALAFIDAHASDDELYLPQVAQAVHLTPAAFSRFFQRMAGVSFVDHVNALRIGRAARLLAESDRAIAEIAFACGFGNLANFNRRFREQKAMAPRAFRAHYV
ncbi:MAG: activator protein MtlR [Rariglobus sp.]|jgi:AraC-like DNA-binding protein|nr:activator protein MtlR [Rariglobus sp.]